MAALSDRLLAISYGIEKGQTMADIGTDHGFLPLFLWEGRICPRVVMTDLSVGPLNKAKKAFNGIDGAGCVDFRVGDGLEPLCAGEVDVVVIAGMGGVLITHILGRDTDKTLSFGKYVLQPRNGAGKLRYWLREAGFAVVSESLAAEGRFICEVIIAVPPAAVKRLPSLDEYPDDIKYEIPSCPACESSALFPEFLNRKLNIEKKVLNAMQQGKFEGAEKTSRTENRIRFLEDRIRRQNNDEHG
ncbi:MAG: class I SAM-dependent methyltransferase [Clostridiales bacterium]|nr:class I SAM-dependent methyltransferase [Clostridiales bacterium]